MTLNFVVVMYSLAVMSYLICEEDNAWDWDKNAVKDWDTFLLSATSLLLAITASNILESFQMVLYNGVAICSAMIIFDCVIATIKYLVNKGKVNGKLV
jgi:hypothetical protein